MSLGLVMGGGGIVGIAWETGVLAGLSETCGFDPTAATVIMGSSAGSVIGAQAALGRDLDELVEFQRRPPAAAATARPAPDLTKGTQGEIIQLLMSGRDDAGPRIGELARHADTDLSEEEFVESFRPILGTDEWPAVDLRVTSSDCKTGRGVVWSRQSGIGLVRAVASSCAIPGSFPTVEFDGRRYMDGPRGKGHTSRVLTEAHVDTAVFIGPMAAMAQFSSVMDSELDLVRQQGIDLHTITGGEGLAAIGFNLMDVRRRVEAVDAGLADGRAAAHAVAKVLASASSR